MFVVSIFLFLPHILQHFYLFIPSTLSYTSFQDVTDYVPQRNYIILHRPVLSLKYFLLPEQRCYQARNSGTQKPHWFHSWVQKEEAIYQRHRLRPSISRWETFSAPYLLSKLRVQFSFEINRASFWISWSMLGHAWTFVTNFPPLSQKTISTSALRHYYQTNPSRTQSASMKLATHVTKRTLDLMIN